MAHTKFFSPIALVVLLSAPLLLDAQTTEKTMLKSFNLDGKGTVALELPPSAVVDVKEWDKPTIQIQITVGLPNGNTAMLNELANVGRYNFVSKSDGDRLLVTAPNLAKIIRIKGQELKEVITLHIFAPRSVVVKITDSTTAAVDKK